MNHPNQDRSIPDPPHPHPSAPIPPFNLMTNFEDLVNQLRCLVLSTSPVEIKQEERDRLAAALTHAGYGSHATFMGLSLPAWVRAGCPMSRRAQSPLEVFEEFPGLRMMPIPAGRFLMGSSPEEPGWFGDEGPQHEVHLREFFLAQTPITQAQWRTVAEWERQEHEDGELWPQELDPDPVERLKDPDRFRGPQRPVVNVSWREAMAFCQRLTLRTGKNYTLPSEAQWEYACRAGTTTPFHFGATISTDLANYNGTFAYTNGLKGVKRGETTPVASFPANAWGLHGMHGNVSEWCADHWHDNYEGAPEDGRAWLNENADEGEERLLRGGSWLSRPQDCRSAYRGGDRPDNIGAAVGFRVCCLPWSSAD